MKNKHASAMAKLRWSKVSKEDRKAYSDALITARIKKYGQKRHKVVQKVIHS